jgi:predicted nucleic-acid-binding protein
VSCYFSKDATPGNLSTNGKREISHSVLDTLVNCKAFVVEVAKNLIIRFLKSDLEKIYK